MGILENVIDTKEASELWVLNQDHIKRMCSSGEIKAKKIGNSWAIDGTQWNPKKNRKGGVKMKERFEALSIDNKIWDDLIFIKKPILHITEKNDDMGKTIFVYFTMTVRRPYARYIYKSDEAYNEQFHDVTKQSQVKYFAQVMYLEFVEKDGENPYTWDTEGINGLQENVSKYITEQMKLRIK